MDRETAKQEWEKRNLESILGGDQIAYPNPDYVKRQLIDGVVVETMPNKPKEATK